MNEIEQLTGVGHTAALRIIEEAGLKQDKAERKKLRAASPELRDQIAATYSSGLSIIKTAAQLGTTHDIVYDEIKRRGMVRARG